MQETIYDFTGLWILLVIVFIFRNEIYAKLKSWQVIDNKDEKIKNLEELVKEIRKQRDMNVESCSLGVKQLERISLKLVEAERKENDLIKENSRLQELYLQLHVKNANKRSALRALNRKLAWLKALQG